MSISIFQSPDDGDVTVFNCKRNFQPMHYTFSKVSASYLPNRSLRCSYDGTIVFSTLENPLVDINIITADKFNQAIRICAKKFGEILTSGGIGGDAILCRKLNADPRKLFHNMVQADY